MIIYKNTEPHGINVWRVRVCVVAAVSIKCFVVWDVLQWGATLKIEKVGSAETLVLCYQTTWCHFLVFSVPNCTYWSIGLLKALNFILLEIKRRDRSSTSGLISVMRRIHIPTPPHTILLCASVAYWMERIASWCGRGRKSIIEQFGQDLFTVGVMIWDFFVPSGLCDMIEMCNCKTYRKKWLSYSLSSTRSSRI